MNNNNEEQEKITQHKSIFTKGVKDKTIGLFSDSFLNKMKAFDYLGIPFITFATSGIFKYKYFTNIIMIEAYLLSDYGKTSIVKNNNSHCLILLESTKRKVLVEASIRNYKLQLGKLEMDILDYLSSYMTETSSDKNNSKKRQKS